MLEMKEANAHGLFCHKNIPEFTGQSQPAASYSSSSLLKFLRFIAGAMICVCLNGCGFLSFFSASNDGNVPRLRKSTVIKTACTQLGKNYRAGEASPHKGFDCSGLVWWSYKQHGIDVPRRTVEQAKAGKAVSKKHARAGDIVVFKTSNSPNGLHTGLYYNREKFLHSPSKGKKVCLEKLSGGWWSKRLVAIRRVAQQ